MIQKSIISYAVEKPFLDYEQGEIVQLDSSLAEPLISAGVLREATQEDVDGVEATEEVEAPEMIENAVRNIKTKLDSSLEQAVKNISEKFSKPEPRLPAVTKENNDGTWGFNSLGEYAKTVIAKEHNNLEANRRIQDAKKRFATKGFMSTGGGPSVTASDVGNLIPPAYAAQLFDKIKGITNLYDFLQDEPFTGNTLEVPVDNSTSFSSGVTVAWTNEASAIADSTLPLGMVELKLNALAAIVNITDYALEDNAYSLDSYIANHVPKKMVSELNKSVLTGTGNGANIIGNSATVVVTRDVALATGLRISFKDVINMYSRMATGYLEGAKWFISPSVLPELMRLSFPDTSGAYPIFVPTGNIGGYPSVQYAPCGYLYGKEVVLCSNMGALGSKGDILFANLSAVSKIQKAMDGKMTPFLYFDKAISTLRFILRCNSKSRWLTTFTRPDGVVESPFVTLAASV